MDNTVEISLKQDEILFTKGEHHNDLYILNHGKLAVCINEKNKVTVVAYIEAGNYIGEMSFFDSEPRSAHIICVEDAQLIKIPVTEIEEQMPEWMTMLAKSMTQKIRLLNNLINTKGIKKQNTSTVEPLSPQEQGRYYKLIQTYKKEHNLE